MTTSGDFLKQNRDATPGMVHKPSVFPVRQWMTLALGLGYTVFSEWYNVYRLGSWAYAEAMPRILGIGLTPLLQWLIVPAVMLVLVRRAGNRLYHNVTRSQP